jgi:Tol biopolymer transport system component
MRDVGDARIELADDRNDGHAAGLVANASSRLWLVWSASIVILALIGALLALVRLDTVPAPPEMRVEITTPPTADPVSVALSPDGRTLAFVATHEGRSRLWLRPLSSTSSRSLEGTDGASCPFWSPGNATIGFFADGKLKRVDIDTGTVRTLSAALPCGGTWNRDDTILFAGPLSGPISRISATNAGTGAVGARVDVTRVGRPSQAGHRFPQFLPDGRHFLYYAGGTPEGRGIYVGDLNGSASIRLLDADTAAVYVPSGHLLFVRQGTLFAQEFDPTRSVLRGTPFQIEEHVAFDPSRYVAAVSASSGGILVYRSGSAARRQFVWIDRSGQELEKVGDPDPENPLDPALSPDEHRVALYRVVNGRPDIWLLEPGGARNRFTSEEISAATAGRPIWSPDGTQIVFASLAKKVTDLFRRPVAGGTIELLLETDQPKAATDWSTDGRFLLYRSFDPKTGWDIWALPMDSHGSPGTQFTVLRTTFDETNGQLAPDGKWVAYQSNETGRFEVYVRPFPGPGSKWPVSRNGGAQVRWRRDGKELFYVGLDARLMAVPIQLASTSLQIEIGTPAPLFTTHIGGAVQGADRQQYMVSSDGQRFLMNTILEEPTRPIIVVLNWRAIH